MPLSKPKLNEFREVQSKARSSYNDEYDRVSSHYIENYKAEQLGCKQETKFTFTEKYADEELGFFRRVPDPGEVQGICLSKQDWIFIIQIQLQQQQEL
ncbi:hypothetical protein ACFXTH_011044 [Malus domestica]